MYQDGMTTSDILKPVIVKVEELIDISDLLGTIEVGKFDDIIAILASPIKNIEE